MKWKSHFCHQACSGVWWGFALHTVVLWTFSLMWLYIQKLQSDHLYLPSGIWIFARLSHSYLQHSQPLSNYENGLITDIHYSVLEKLHTFNYAKMFSEGIKHICFPVSFSHPLLTESRNFQKDFHVMKGDYLCETYPVQLALIPLNQAAISFVLYYTYTMV